MLTIIPGQDIPSRWSSRLIQFDCSCGNRVWKPWVKFAGGSVRRCGTCNLLTAEQWANRKFGKLRMLHPEDISFGSNKVVTWACDCGNESQVPVVRVFTGVTKSCGCCNLLPVSFWETKKFGKLRMEHPVDVHGSSSKKVKWVCDCGKTSSIKVIAVTRGHRKTCGACNSFDEDFWRASKFGHLRMKEPKSFKLRSNKKVLWTCDCGGEVLAVVTNVTRGRTTRCGKCQKPVRDWYEKNREKIASLKTPIVEEDLPEGPFRISRVVEKTRKAFDSVCSACGSEYRPRWEHVRAGVSLTCGCFTNRVSQAQSEISSYIQSLGVNTALEHKVGPFTFDIFVPSASLLIEHNGLRWHKDNTKDKDFRKYEFAISSGFRYMMIFEDEWVKTRLKVEDLIRNRLGLHKPTSVRPSNCSISRISPKKASEFHSLHHYIGSCRAKVHYGVFKDKRLLSVASFGKPSRPSKHTWELRRMSSDPGFRVHGIWSKILVPFIQEESPTSIVSFSDNRLFSGSVYEKLGFKLDGELEPDYYWCKGIHRHHKSGLRKRGDDLDSDLTEFELRTQDGYHRIWDVGKKRWIYSI